MHALLVHSAGILYQAHENINSLLNDHVKRGDWALAESGWVRFICIQGSSERWCRGSKKCKASAFFLSEKKGHPSTCASALAFLSRLALGSASLGSPNEMHAVCNGTPLDPSHLLREGCCKWVALQLMAAWSATPLARQPFISPYHAFCKVQRPRLAPGLRNAQRETLLGQKWKALSEIEKAKYKVEQAASVRPFCVFSQHQRPLLPRGLRNAEREKLLGQMWKALSETQKAAFSNEGPTATPVLATATATADPSPAVQPARVQPARVQPARAKRAKAAAAGSATTPSPTAAPPLSPKLPPLPVRSLRYKTAPVVPAAPTTPALAAVPVVPSATFAPAAVDAAFAEALAPSAVPTCAVELTAVESVRLGQILTDALDQAEFQRLFEPRHKRQTDQDLDSPTSWLEQATESY